MRLLAPRRLSDERGFFEEVWRADVFAKVGIDVVFVQDNQSLSRQAGVVRGLHFQTGASAQAKLVRCTRGAIFNVAVDVRHGSPSFGRHVCARLSGANGLQVFVPVGFAHGFCTLEPDTEVFYKVSAYYDRDADRGLAWDDPNVGIPWPVESDKAILSPKDRMQPRLADLPCFFPYSDYPD